MGDDRQADAETGGQDPVSPARPRPAEGAAPHVLLLGTPRGRPSAEGRTGAADGLLQHLRQERKEDSLSPHGLDWRRRKMPQHRGALNTLTRGSRLDAGKSGPVDVEQAGELPTPDGDVCEVVEAVAGTGAEVLRDLLTGAVSADAVLLAIDVSGGTPAPALGNAAGRGSGGRAGAASASKGGEAAAGEPRGESASAGVRFRGAGETLRGQTLENLQMATALGIRRLVVCVVGVGVDDEQGDPATRGQGAGESLFKDSRRELHSLLEPLGYETGSFPVVPVTRGLGSCGPTPDWYEGPSLLSSLLVQGPAEASLANRPLRALVQEVYKRRGEELIATALIETGMLRSAEVGLVLTPGLPELRFRKLEAKPGAGPISQAGPGDEVTLVGVELGQEEEELDQTVQFGATPASLESCPGSSTPHGLAPGMVISERSRRPAESCKKFLGMFAVLSDPSGSGLSVGYQATLDVHSAHVPCTIVELCWSRAGVAGGLSAQPSPKLLRPGDVAEVWVEPHVPVCVEVFGFCPPLGRVALRRGGVTVAAGIAKVVHRRAKTGPSPVANFDDD